MQTLILIPKRGKTSSDGDARQSSSARSWEETGEDPFPIAKKVPQPPILDSAPNPFIQEGEFYLAGRGDWNPWGPASPEKPRHCLFPP